MRYAQWRRESAEPGKVPEYDDIDEKGAARLIDRWLTGGQGLTLGPDRTCDLLAAYGIHVHRALPAPTPGTAAEAARTLGYPVALKATAPTCAIAPTSAASASTSPTRASCAAPTPS